MDSELKETCAPSSLHHRQNSQNAFGIILSIHMRLLKDACVMADGTLRSFGSLKVEDNNG